MQRKIHFIYGILLIIVFLATGQYMEIVHDRLSGFDGGARMMFRANHIYILFIAVMNVIFSLVPKNESDSIDHLIDKLISVILFVIPGFIIYGFFTEPFTEDFTRAVTRYGIYLTMAVAVLIVLRYVVMKYFKKN